MKLSEEKVIEIVNNNEDLLFEKFNLDDENEYLDCCNYTNIPLLTITNKEKSNKWTDENNKYWNDNIKNKEYHEIYIP